MSGSRDGKILIWNALPAKNQLKLVEGYLMLIDYLPRNHHRSLGTEMGGLKYKAFCDPLIFENI